MKKVSIGAILILIILLMGCQQDALKYYQESSLKTDAIDRAKSTIDLQLKVEVSELLKDEEPTLTDFISEINFNTSTQFDQKLGKRIASQYIGNGLIGIDTVYYKDGDNEYLKIPFTGKYISLDQLMSDEDLDFSMYEEVPISDNAVEALKDLWFNLAGQDDVVKLGNEVIDTPEGEVKVKKFVISFSHEQIQTFLKEAMNILEGDELLRSKIKDYPLFIIEDGKMTISNDSFEIDVDEVLDSLRLALRDMIIEEFKLITYIDVDQYIIESEYEIKVSFKGFLVDYLENVEFKLKYALYDLHEKIKFNFPEINDSNTTTIDEVLETLEFEIPFEE